MITASHEHDVDDTSTKWIGSKLKNRTVRAEIRGVSFMMEVRRGCQQGAFVEHGNQGLWAQGFADDILILINGKF
jgi:hypothetical protein